MTCYLIYYVTQKSRTLQSVYTLCYKVMPGAVFGHPGYGGQIGAGDTVHRAGWAYVTNYPAAGLGDDAPQYKALRQALQTCLEEE